MQDKESMDYKKVIRRTLWNRAMPIGSKYEGQFVDIIELDFTYDESENLSSLHLKYS